VVLVHELGHFLAAKKAGVCVEEFGFGMPPRIFGIKKGETTYSINWIPFGGFVRMLGEDNSSKSAKVSKRSFQNQPLRKQAMIICGGVFMNLLLAFLLLTFGFLIGIEPLIANEEDFFNAIRSGSVELAVGVPSDEAVVGEDDLVYIPRLSYFEDETSVFYGLLNNGESIISVGLGAILTEDDLTLAFSENSGKNLELTVYSESGGERVVSFAVPEVHPIINYIEDGSPADEIGLMLGDSIKTVGGEEVTDAEAVILATQSYQKDGMISYEIVRDGEVIFLEIPLREKDSRVGIGLADLLPYYGNLSLYPSYVPHTLVKVNPVQYGFMAPVMAGTEMLRLGKMTAVMFLSVLKQFFMANGVPDGVTGPVGIAQMTATTLQYGFAAMIRFVALLSLSLGVINMLPIPAMDGGHFAFIAYKAVTGHKPNPKWEHFIHLIGFVFLGILLLYVTFNDVLNLF